MILHKINTNPGTLEHRLKTNQFKESKVYIFWNLTTFFGIADQK